MRCYVTPAPGVNLQHYVGRQVGVTGTRGYMPEQHASHIMARHVTPLEGHDVEVGCATSRLKARLADLRGGPTRWPQPSPPSGWATQHQIDTYFHCRHGRLKLRQIDGLRAELVWYARPDEEGPKPSDYQLVPLQNPETLKAALAAALGVRAVVEKRREIFLYHSVRIHLDDVVGLGHFIEFEAVLGATPTKRPAGRCWTA